MLAALNKSARLLIIAGAEINLCISEIGRLGKLLFAAGEEEAMRKYTEPDSELRLSHLCRASIRKHLLQMSDMNLFARVPKLGIPKPLMKYLLFTEMLDEDDDVFLSSLLPRCDKRTSAADGQHWSVHQCTETDSPESSRDTFGV